MNANDERFDESLISAYLDGELSEPERLAVESALQESPPLQKLVRDLSTVRSLVAASSDKSATLSRSLQSSEWMSSAAGNAHSSSDRDAVIPTSKLDSVAKRNRMTIGLLASLAAVLLIFLTTNFLIDQETAVAPQVALDANAQKISSETDNAITPSDAREIPTDLQSTVNRPDRVASSVPPPAASSAASSLENGARTEAAIPPGLVMALPPNPTAPSPTDSIPMSADPMDDLPLTAQSATTTAPMAFQPGPSTSGLSVESQSLFVYLEQRLNANEDGPNSVRWRLAAKDNLETHAFHATQTLAVSGAEQIAANTEEIAANTELTVTNADRDVVKEIGVERGESEDEFVINLTRDEAQKFFQLADPERDNFSDLSNVDELLAIAKPASLSNEQPLESGISVRGRAQNLPASPPVADAPQLRKWDLEFTIPAPSSPLLAGSGNLGAGGFGPGGVGPDGFGAVGVGPGGVGASGGAATLMEFGPSSPNVGLPGGGNGKVEASEMKTTTPAESQRSSTAKSTQTNNSRLNKTNAATVPSDAANGTSAESGEIPDQPAKDKPIRIRIKIKKEPGSSDSNE